VAEPKKSSQRSNVFLKCGNRMFGRGRTKREIDPYGDGLAVNTQADRGVVQGSVRDIPRSNSSAGGLLENRVLVVEAKRRGANAADK
jgi:hypothetical protein